MNPSPEWVEQLARRVPTLIGWKDGQGDTVRYQQIMDRVGDRLCWVGGAGDAWVPAYYKIGIRTYTSSIATVAPKLSLRLDEIASAGDSPALIGLAAGTVRPPLPNLRSEEVAELKVLLEKWRPFLS